MDFTNYHCPCCYWTQAVLFRRNADPNFYSPSWHFEMEAIGDAMVEALAAIGRQHEERRRAQ